MKHILRIVIISMLLGFVTASEITFSPNSGDIQAGCLVAVDIIADTKGHAVAATDVIIETALEYVDFVPSQELFAHFLPPKINDYSIHIIGFVSNPESTAKGSGSIGKLFLKQRNNTDADGSLKLYFAGTGKTYDSNLSILGGIDVLENTGEGLYRFVNSGTCTYPANYSIIGGFAHMSAEDALNATINKMKRQEWLQHNTIILLSLLVIILLLLFILWKKRYSGQRK